jgi:hypothetical protein
MPLVPNAVMEGARRKMEAAMIDTVYIHGPSTRTRVDLPGGDWEYVEGAGMPSITIGMVGPLSKASIEQLRADRIEETGYTVEGVTALGTYAVSQTVIVKAL